MTKPLDHPRPTGRPIPTRPVVTDYRHAPERFDFELGVYTPDPALGIQWDAAKGHFRRSHNPWAAIALIAVGLVVGSVAGAMSIYTITALVALLAGR